MLALIFVTALIVVYALCNYRSLGVNLQQLTLERTLPARGILALTVIMHHLSQNKITPPHWLFDELGAVAVGAFFIMSGYGLACSYARKGDDYLKGFLRKRLWKLMLPFLIAVAAWNVEELFLYPPERHIELWLQLLHGGTNGLLPHSWYIIAAMLFYVFFYIVYRTFHTTRWRLATLFLLWAAYYIWCAKVWQCGGWWCMTAHMFPLGFVYYHAERYICRINAYVWLMLWLFVGAFSIHYTIPFYSPISHTAFSLIIIGGITIFTQYGRVLRFLGHISYELYIVQGLPFFALRDSGLHPFVITMLCVGLDVALAYALHSVVKRIGQPRRA